CSTNSTCAHYTRLTCLNQNRRMLSSTPRLLLSAIAFLGGVAASAQQLPSALTTDPPSDKEFPPTMEAPDILSLAQISFETPRLPRDQHSDVAVKRHRAGLAHAAAKLAATYCIEIVGCCSGCHVSLREKAS